MKVSKIKDFEIDGCSIAPSIIGAPEPIKRHHLENLHKFIVKLTLCFKKLIGGVPQFETASTAAKLGAYFSCVDAPIPAGYW